MYYLIVLLQNWRLYSSNTGGGESTLKRAALNFAGPQFERLAASRSMHKPVYLQIWDSQCVPAGP